MTLQRKACIFMVEDNPADVHMFRLTLEHSELDCELLVLQDGGQALDWVRSYNAAAPHSSVPDIAVIDLNLPKHDGIEILTAMHSNPALAAVPSLVLSSSPSPRDVARVTAFPNTQYSRKPFLLDEYASLGKTIQSMLEDAKKVRIVSL